MSRPRQMPSLVVAVLLSLSSAAMARQQEDGPGVIVTRFRGVGAKAAQAQLASSLCKQLRCLPPSRSAEDREAADAVVFGRVVRARSGGLALKLSVMDEELNPLKKIELPLDRSKRLRRTGLRMATRTVLKAATAQQRLSEADAQEDAVEEEAAGADDEQGFDSDDGAEPVAAASPPVAGAPSSSAKSAVTATVLAASPTSRSLPSTAAKNPDSWASATSGSPSLEATGLMQRAASTDVDGRPWLVLQVDGQLTAREARFAGGAAAPSANRIFSPLLHFQVFPRALGGLGVDGRFSQTFGNSATLASSASASLDVAMQEVLVGWRLGTTHSSYLKPQVGLRRHAASLQRAEGSGFVDAPGVDYRGWTAGVAGGWAFARSWRIEGRAAYLGILSSGELISQAFFPKGQSHGGEGSLALAKGIYGRMELVGSVNVSLYHHRFDTEPGQLYVAQGGTDRFLSGSMGLRTAF